MRIITESVKHLLMLNGIFFIASLSFGDLVYDLFALHYPTNPKFQYWQPLTHMFMHGDLGHIFFNMFGLYMFGTPIEQMWGKKQIYFLLSLYWIWSCCFTTIALLLSNWSSDIPSSRRGNVFI